MPAKSAYGPEGTETLRSHAYDDAFVRMSRPRSRRGAKAARWMVWGFITLIVLFTLGNVLLARSNRALNSQLSSSLQTQYNPSFKVRYAELGRQIVLSWYASEPPPVSLGKGVSWPNQLGDPYASGTTITAVTPSPSTPALQVSGVAFLSGREMQSPGSTTQYQEQDTYYAIVNGLPYDVTVDLAIPDINDYSSQPVLLAAPTLVPATDPGSSTLTDQPANVSTITLPQAAQQSLSQWAQAWTTDDRTTLKQLTQDQSTVDTYRGEPGGWQYVSNSLTVAWAAQYKGNTVAEVQWQMAVPAPTPTTGSGTTTTTTPQSGPTQTQTMDVLIGNPNGGTPSIQAWGPVGTYPTLQPYMNALSGPALTTLPSPVPVATPTVAGN